MKPSYGVVWREGSDPLAIGKLELCPRGVRFEGLANALPTAHDVPYERVAAIRVGRSAADRIDGRPTVIIERREAPPIAISTVAQPSLVSEIAELLGSLQLGSVASRRTAVVVPLREGAVDAVRALLRRGPPFDPARTAGLERHEVFLTPSEVVFLFDSRLGSEALERAFEDPETLKAAAEWAEHIAGPPRIAEAAFSWARTDPQLDDTLVPPGLRGADGVA